MTEEPDVYIGTYVDYTPADSDDPSKYAWMRFQGLQGDAGEKGIPGVNGADGKTSFLHIKYSDDGQTFTANNGETPGAWIGQYTDFTEADSSVFSRYAWTKIKGDKGDKGDPGKDGIQGTPGAILRSRGVWKPSEVYIRSAEFIDWVVYGPQKYRYVVKSGVATVPAGILPTNTAYWTAFNEMEPVAAPMFLGETASFDVVGIAGDPCAGGGFVRIRVDADRREDLAYPDGAGAECERENRSPRRIGYRNVRKKFGGMDAAESRRREAGRHRRRRCGCGR